MITLLVVTGLLLGLSGASQVQATNPGCNQEVYSYQTDLSPNGLFTLLLKLESSYVLESEVYIHYSLWGLAAMQASEIPLGVKQQLAAHAPLMNILIDALAKFADMSGENLVEAKVCDLKCRKSVHAYYDKLRPKSLKKYKIHEDLDKLKALTLMKSIAGVKGAPELTNELLDEVYDEFTVMKANKTTSELSLDKFMELEREAAYRALQSPSFVLILRPLYQSECKQRSPDFPATYKEKYLAQLKRHYYAFNKDGRIVWESDL